MTDHRDRQSRGRPIDTSNHTWVEYADRWTSDGNGKRAAGLLCLIEIAKLNGIDPEARLGNVLTRTADHPVNRIDEPLPWNCQVTPKTA